MNNTLYDLARYYIYEASNKEYIEKGKTKVSEDTFNLVIAISCMENKREAAILVLKEFNLWPLPNYDIDVTEYLKMLEEME